MFSARVQALPSCSVLRTPTRFSICQCIFHLHQVRRGYASKDFAPIPPEISSLDSPEDSKKAKQWADAFRKVVIPRDAVELSFSRSSGPGGQNVNKVNTKATAKCELAAAWIPKWASKALRRNTAYVSATNSLQVTSTVHRSQAQNVDDCLRKLHSLIVEASLDGVKGETSEAQKQRVIGLQKAEKARRREDKEYKSKVKLSRRKGDWD